MVVSLDSPQPVFTLPPLNEIPDGDEDVPKPGLALGEVGALHLPEIVFGAASFSHFYTSDNVLSSDLPVRTVRLALRYGIRAFDTSPYYGSSEIVLGTALKALEAEYPRSSYKLMTKCGRYGAHQENFDYSPATIRASVQRSLSRLHTSYLDTVYLHDVEFVCTPVGPITAGNHAVSLAEKSAEYGLAEGQEGKVWGEGDQKILDAIAELRKLQNEGIVKAIGITGYPLPTLLRIALLVVNTPPYKPLDVLLSYSHLHLQNSTLAAFVPTLSHACAHPQLLTASRSTWACSLRPRPPGTAPPALKEAAQKASQLCVDDKWEGGLPNLAVGFGCRMAEALDLPVVVGLCNLREVHENVAVWRENKERKDQENRIALERQVLKVFGDTQGWSWASP
ncbi:L-galactose dehydrogenase [Grifola frondosa]|uniref:L-galactose dehydrogenase n=1 Tax=Grifola frondosa TaxID=5627 RepID=A0A1C7M4U9_GRIFR|nr:L-galactose dehydrogenase [Grifola frondosa]